MAKVIDPGDADDQLVGGITEEDLKKEMEALSGPKMPTQRNVLAAKLKLRGAPYVEIAQTMEYPSPQAARAAVENTLATMLPDESFESLRRIATGRLEAMLVAVSPDALSAWINVPITDKDGTSRVGADGKKLTKRVRNENFLGSQKMMLAIVDRLIRLQGIDAPTVSVIRTPQADEFEKVIRGVLAEAAGGAEEEGDVLMLDESEDGVWAESGELPKDGDDA